MAVTKKKAKWSATIDVALVVIRTGDSSTGTELAVDTANQIQVEPQINEEDAVQVIKDGKVLAQKLGKSTLTGNRITLTDNVFSPEVAKTLQGGEITGEGETLVYTPPAAGSGETGEVFELDIYSAEYNAAGQIVKYEKITYPNCQGTPIGLGTEDGVFRVPEYTINSAPDTGEPPYKLSYVTELPDFSEAVLSLQSLTADAGTTGVPSVV